MNTKKFLEAANLMQTGQSIVIRGGDSVERRYFIEELQKLYPDYRLCNFPSSRALDRGYIYLAYSGVDYSRLRLPVVSLLPEGKTATITGVQSIVNKGDTAEIGYTGEIKTDEPKPWTPKRGEFCALKSLGAVFIFDRVEDGWVYDLAFRYLDGCIDFGGIPTGTNLILIRPATPSEEKTLLDALEKVGKRWNKETLQLEDLPKFKDGDFVHLSSKDGAHYATAIYRRGELPDTIHLYCGVSAKKGLLARNTHWQGGHPGDPIRLATEEEIKTLELELAKAGKMWDADKKQLVRWRAKKGQGYKYVTGQGNTVSTLDFGPAVDLSLFDLGNYFHPDADTSEYEKRLKDVFEDRL